MKQMGKVRKGVVFAILLTIAVSFAFAAEEQQRPPRRPDGQQRGPGRFDPAAMQERMMNMFQERMGASDEEWAVIKPRLSKVMELNQEASGRGGMMRGMFGRRPRRPEADDQSEVSEVEKATAELQETLEKEAPSAAEIKAKLTALRGAREKARQELAKAQQQLREVLTLEQEAQLVMMGMLD